MQRRIFQFISAFVLILLMGLVAYSLKVKQIECLVENVSDQVFCQQISFLKDESFFFRNFEQTPLYQQVLTNEIGQVYMPISIRRKLPGTLLIEFIREDPLYRLILEDEQVYIVNSMDILVPDSKEFKLTDVTFTNDYSHFINNGKIDEALSKKIHTLIERLSQEAIKIERIEFNQHQSLIVTDKLSFLFSDEDDYVALAKKVGYIMNDLVTVQTAVPEDSTMSLIDMRYDLPIVRLDKR